MGPDGVPRPGPEQLRAMGVALIVASCWMPEAADDAERAKDRLWMVAMLMEARLFYEVAETWLSERKATGKAPRKLALPSRDELYAVAKRLRQSTAGDDAAAKARCQRQAEEATRQAEAAREARIRAGHCTQAEREALAAVDEKIARGYLQMGLPIPAKTLPEVRAKLEAEMDSRAHARQNRSIGA